MIKIYDCSNSSERPQHRGNGCPFENDIMRYLKENSIKYNCKFVNTIKECDVIITNDVFPKEILNIEVPKIKRMDGTYWNFNYVDRNISLNLSAQKADHVIFVSEFSKNSYFDLYGEPLKNYSICLNQVNPNIYYKSNTVNDLIFIANASSWNREEKRFKNILDFANIIKEKLVIIGTLPKEILLPNNCISFGYIENPNLICNILNTTSAFVNFSYRDAAPKIVCQALCCGLPILYSNSGGVPEIVEGYGIGINDYVQNKFELKTPDLNIDSIVKGYKKFKEQYKYIKESIIRRNNKEKFYNMLDHYFNIIKSY